jgi:hypothetical protein
LALIPRIVNSPLVGGTRVVRSLIVVDLPAPFGPKNPKTWPDLIERSMPSTAFTESYDL